MHFIVTIKNGEPQNYHQNVHRIIFFFFFNAMIVVTFRPKIIMHDTVLSSYTLNQKQTVQSQCYNSDCYPTNDFITLYRQK